ncbi:hypothetical protein LZ575_11610 [Antarcticibacterium sp. 1MA-6-2]|uniref:hypothetical protein n=1 Tax=Antarcticibacterium sp. 1MA-6-2 TaxID=2908210 RepID=UPI001F2D519B|nr:hypothetical protein [Antarcticibacterium sp. 1MA-6-2]UJH89707.1 hypothetical protein LZ575_11610 [Antarcticibacterium sp. 1MA-6-2]
MFKKISLAALVLSIAVACGDHSDPYLIEATRVGPLTKEIKINQLDSIFSNDSIVRHTSGNKLLSATNDIEIYDKDGSPLLIIELSTTI